MPSATGRLKPSWSVSRITAMVILQRRSPAGDAAKRATLRRLDTPVPGGVWPTCPADIPQAPRPGWGQPQQPHHRRQGHQLQDQAQRQPGRGSFASGRQRAAPLRQRPGRLPAPEESPPGSAQGHHCHRPQAGQAHHHAALWPGVRGCRRRILRETVSAGRCARPSVGRPNCYQLVPILRTSRPIAA